MRHKKIKNILVPLDGSKNSIRGLDEAIYIARHTHATITGVFVRYLPPIYAIHPIGFLGKDFEKAAKRILESAKTRSAKNGILFKYKIIRSADPGYYIVQFAHSKKNRIDLIIIGSRGQGMAREMFFGSVSHHVLHASSVPVLVVK